MYIYTIYNFISLFSMIFYQCFKENIRRTHEVHIASFVHVNIPINQPRKRNTNNPAFFFFCHINAVSGDLLGWNSSSHLPFEYLSRTNGKCSDVNHLFTHSYTEMFCGCLEVDVETLCSVYLCLSFEQSYPFLSHCESGSTKPRPLSKPVSHFRNLFVQPL